MISIFGDQISKKDDGSFKILAKNIKNKDKKEINYKIFPQYVIFILYFGDGLEKLLCIT